MMKLLRFRVTNFRSVDDSGWIETDSVTALIGTNESGKTNLLVPLWKLNPAKGGQINPIADYPRKRYNDIRSMENKPLFIEAVFQLPEPMAEHIAELTSINKEEVSIVSICRDLSGTYSIEFPESSPARSIPKDDLNKLLSSAKSEIEALPAGKTETELKSKMLETINSCINGLDQKPQNIDKQLLESIRETLSEVNTDGAPKRSAIAPRYGALSDDVDEFIEHVGKPRPSSNEEVKNYILQNMPTFVYYSNYGNLDSEIYLPHVIQNMNRTDLGTKEEAKARTLKVLFEFVKLEPEEIHELGQDFNQAQRPPTDEEIKDIAEKKKERDILLQSASTELTHKFKAWWKQGNYRFRFQADGNHFRIWVSDDKRPEDIELEGRSTGLQWFLSFYLIFLVESSDSHQGSILLLDEPGLSLHPLAQRDLSDFFKGLSNTNQILYTTHSPFMVDPDQLDRVKAVYIDDNGLTAVSANLRAGEAKGEQSKSIYPVYAALGLTVSDTLLQGCKPVIVEGSSDQYNLVAIKNYLIGKGLFCPMRDILFIPGGGVKGIGAVVSILTGKEETLPYVILDSDKSGQDLEKKLKSGLYKDEHEKIIMIEQIIGMQNSEIEDIFPNTFISGVVSRWLRGPEEFFEDVVVKGEPIIPQIEAYAQKHAIPLVSGWKVELAKRVKNRLLKGDDPVKPDEEYIEKWKNLFNKINS